MINSKYIRLINISLITLLVGSFFSMPYGYYQAVRVFGIIGFSILAYDAHKNNLVMLAFVYGIAAILFNPIIKIAFDKNVWHVIDIILAIVIIVDLIKKNKTRVTKRD